MNIGPRLKRLRRQRGLTQQQLATKVRVTSVYIAMLEGSAKRPPARRPSLRMLERLAKALRVTVADLVR
jgi:transcriptional regulator with XRE-family HTH domain